MKERDSRQPSGHSMAMMRFWHDEGAVLEGRREERRMNSAKANRERAVITKMVLPLAFRGATTEEIHKIQGIEPIRINNSLSKARARGVLPRPSKEQTRKALSQAHLVKFSQEEENKFALAKRMIEEGLVGDNLSNWEDLSLLYKKSKRSLPKNFVDKIILELYVLLVKGLKNEDSTSSIKYGRLLREDSFGSFFEQLKSEKGFLLAKLLTDWADGEDEDGFFKIKNGKKARHIETEDGKIVHDSSAFQIKKLGNPLPR